MDSDSELVNCWYLPIVNPDRGSFMLPQKAYHSRALTSIVYTLESRCRTRTFRL